MNNNHSKHLRQNMTETEKMLWERLRDRQVIGCKFRRQHCIGNYIVDFYCADKKLMVELDGGQHALQIGFDRQRTQLLESLGYKVIRFWNNDVLTNPEGMLVRIKEHLGTPHPASYGYPLGATGTTIKR